MRTLSFPTPPLADYHVAGVKRIVEACRKNNFHISTDDAYRLWKEYSDSYAAGWLVMDGYTNADLVTIAARYCTISGQDDEHFFGW